MKIICLVESYIGFLLLYRFTKRFFGSFAAFAALILYSIAPFQIIYTLYVRFYALVMTLVIAECFTYMLALEHNEIKLRLRYLALTLLFALLSYCTHQFSVFLQPVFLLHFIIFCFWRRFARESLYYYLSGALLLIAFSVGAYFFSEPLMKAASLVYGTQNAWLPHQIGLASQRLQTFFWSSALPIRSCSLIFLWVSLGLAAAARLGRRQPLWGELFLSLGIVIPFFFLSHFHFSPSAAVSDDHYRAVHR